MKSRDRSTKHILTREYFFRRQFNHEAISLGLPVVKAREVGLQIQDGPVVPQLWPLEELVRRALPVAHSFSFTNINNIFRIKTQL